MQLRSFSATKEFYPAKLLGATNLLVIISLSLEYIACNLLAFGLANL